MDPHRLPRDVIPRQYRVVLEPDIEAGTFTGTVAIDVEVAERTDRIVCNAAELDIDSAVVSPQAATSDRRSVEPVVEEDADTERLHLVLPAPLERGPALVEISFRGTLNDQLRGFYRSTYTDDDGTEHTIATTQFQSTDARRAFPCWDEPDLKATFSVTLVVDPDHLAVANTVEIGREPASDGRVAVHFADTIPMSTYLVAFVVGRLEVTEPVDAAGTAVRVVHRPGQARLTPFALEVATAALEFFTDYYDLPYPGDKLDLLAIPDFAFGAMENLGCVTFREVLLLVDPGQASQSELQRVADVVNHELAHMWFGDLVTMKWWNGIWLNEAFATFMEMLATDSFRPEWDRWTDFGLSRTAAFDVDALESTRPIEYPVQSPADAEGMFDVLTYEKGAAVVRMLEQHVGPAAFRDGVRRYLRTHRYSNTDTGDLWEALAAETDTDVAALMEGWIFQGGHPIVSYVRQAEGLALAQRRFGYGPTDDRRWSVPLGVAEPDGTTHPLLGDALTVAAHPLPRLNVDGNGFYRVAHDEAALTAAADGQAAEWPAVERYGLVDDAWARTLAGDLDVFTFLSVCDGFAADDELAVWQRMVAAFTALDHVAPDTHRGELTTRFTRLLAPVADRLGETADDDETERTRQLRATVRTALGTLTDDPDVEGWARRVDAEGDPDPELVSAAVAVVAARGDDTDFDRYWDRYRNATSPQVERRHLDALADFPHAGAIETVCDRALDGTIRSQDAPYLLARALTNRAYGPLVWQRVTDGWSIVNERFPSNSIARLLSGVRALSQPGVAPSVEAFLDTHPVPQGEQMIAQHRERLGVNVALRSRIEAQLSGA